MAPTTLPKASGNRVKNFSRLRNTRKESLKKAKQNLLSFLLRMGRTFGEGKSYWTHLHFKWLKGQKFDDMVDQETFDEYLQEVHDQQEKVAKLCCFRGIETHTALSPVSEIGDFSRFATAQQFSAFLGPVPGEQSSGQRERRGAITKAGDTRLRLRYRNLWTIGREGWVDRTIGQRSCHLRLHPCGDSRNETERAVGGPLVCGIQSTHIRMVKCRTLISCLSILLDDY